MWNSRHVTTTLYSSTACYRDSFTLLHHYFGNRTLSDHRLLLTLSSAILYMNVTMLYCSKLYWLYCSQSIHILLQLPILSRGMALFPLTCGYLEQAFHVFHNEPCRLLITRDFKTMCLAPGKAYITFHPRPVLTIRKRALSFCLISAGKWWRHKKITPLSS
jgi:hypothetical protein